MYKTKNSLLVGMLFLLLIIAGCGGEQNMALPDNLPKFVLESDFEIIDWDRQVVEFDGMIGNENIIGVIGADLPSLDSQKWMWHLWGIGEVLESEMTVVGYHKETQPVQPILINANDGWSVTLAGKNNGADAHIPTSVKFAETGEWALLVYVDEELFDVLVLTVNE